MYKVGQKVKFRDLRGRLLQGVIRYPNGRKGFWVEVEQSIMSNILLWGKMYKFPTWQAYVPKENILP